MEVILRMWQSWDTHTGCLDSQCAEVSLLMKSQYPQCDQVSLPIKSQYSQGAQISLLIKSQYSQGAQISLPFQQ